MESFSPTSILPRMQAEFSRRMLEEIEQDIERMFAQDSAQAGFTTNGRTHATM